MHTMDPSLPDHCEPSGPVLAFLSSHLGVCVPTPLALISTILGFMSILSWLFAQLPQIVKNYAVQSTSGLSLFFLVEWCLGDGTNLVGALFTRQAVWQVIVAGYYVCVDVILVAQYAWYSYLKPKRERSRVQGLGIQTRGSDRFDDSTYDDIIEGVSIESGASDSSNSRTATKDDSDGLNTSRKTRPEPPTYPSHRDHPSQRQASANPIAFSRPLTRSLLLSSIWCATASAHPVSILTTRSSGSRGVDTETVGRILSWASTLLYLGSRLPQLYKNHSRRSTAGLSAKLFIAAFFGNLFYSCSLLTNPCAWEDFGPYGGGGWVSRDGSDRQDWIGRAAPFFLGAAGVLALDAAVGVQFLAFGERAEDVEVEVVVSGRSRWRSVSGWMRGWVPSARVKEESGSGESEVLIARCHGDRDGYGTT
ncbi:MAG: hypothetical protein M4579_005758 [Chaenotheca gracillima]|nr:MAG: hypothetical protein M4579_005758 [Chaenotheca gracillima]